MLNKTVDITIKFIKKMSIDAYFLDIQKDWHWEVNDDGVRAWHPGYETHICRVCMKPFILSKGYEGTVLTCGRESCDKELKDGATNI